MSNKKHYFVTVTRHIEDCGEPQEISTVLETWAVSKEKAESNARYRTEGKAYWFEAYGTDSFNSWYDYEAKEG